MQTENTQPLYKVLHEKITKGIARIIEPDEIAMDFPGLVIDGEFNTAKNIQKKKVIAEFPDLRGDAYTDIRDEQEANAKYTALAFNNLHKLADALEKINSLPQTIGHAYQMQSIAKEALAAIS